VTVTIPVLTLVYDMALAVTTSSTNLKNPLDPVVPV